MRKNGFERPYSVFQVLSWIVAAFIGISFVIITIALVLSSEDYGGSGHDAVCILLAIAYAISFIGMIYFTYLVTAFLAIFEILIGPGRYLSMVIKRVPL